jgi:predicted permease
MTLYPPGFRYTFGPEMRDLFEAELRRRRVRGRLYATRYAVRTLLATAWGATWERVHHWRHLGSERSGVRGRSTSDREREGRKTMRIDELRQDLTVLFRQLRRRPGFTVVVVATLTLGVGMSTGVYSVVRGVLLRPLPYPESNELVSLTRAGAASLPNIADLEGRLESMERMGGMFVPSTVTLTGSGDATQLSRSWVTPGFFDMLGIQPALGRWLGPQDDDTDRAVLSHRLWQTRFAADPGVVGRTIVLDESPVEIVGVAPASVGEPFDVDVWKPLPWAPGEGAKAARAWRAVEPYGRLADGWTLEDARAELETEWDRLQELYPDENGRFEVGLVTLRSRITDDEEAPLRILFWASVLFLLVAAANVGVVFVSRLDTRRHEFAVRSSMGAPRLRLVRQAWTEILAVSLVGGLVGVGVAALGVRWAVGGLASSLSRTDAIVMDGSVLGFGLAMSLLTAGLVGTATVLAWGGQGPARLLRAASRSVAGRSSLLRRLLVVGEVAMALVVVTGLGLLVRSFQKVQEIDVGVRTEGVLTANLGRFPSSRYPDNDARRVFQRRLMERLEATPGIERVALSSHLPLGGCCSNQGFHPSDDPEHEVFVEVRWVTPSYFDALGIPIQRGRDLTGLAPDAELGVVISRNLADELFEGGDAVGGRLADSDGDVTVVGVSGTVREYSPVQKPPFLLYVSATQIPTSSAYLVVRSSIPRDQLVPAVRSALRDVDPLLPLDQVRFLDDVLAGHTADRRATTVLMGLLGGLALLLGAVGIYGVMSHAVHGRLREIGVRMALGAHQEQVLRRVLRDAVILVLPGLALGCVGALVARRFIESLLYEVSPLDPAVYAAVLALFVGAAVAAALAPARRAARVDAVEMLREN